jgi:hypothetical protein
LTRLPPRLIRPLLRLTRLLLRLPTRLPLPLRPTKGLAGTSWKQGSQELRKGGPIGPPFLFVLLSGVAQADSGSTSPRFSRWRIMYETMTAPIILPMMKKIQLARLNMAPGSPTPAITCAMSAP